MKFDRPKAAIALVLVVLVFILVTGFAWNFVRDSIAIPIFYVLWLSDLILKSIPQSTYLGVLVVLCLIITISTFQGIRAKPATAGAVASPAQAHTRYLLWRTLGEHLYTSRYFRDQFVEESRKLVLVTLAYQEGVEVAEAEAMVKSGALPVPQAVWTLVSQKAIAAAQPQLSSLKNSAVRWWHSPSRKKLADDTQVDHQVDEIIGFIEHLLEINNAGNQPQS